MTDRRSFLGIPVEGEINNDTSRVDQKPIEELAPIMQAVLDDPTIVEFGWTQYTPYFNDGDVCEFGVNTPWYRTVEDSDDHDEYELELPYHPTIGTRRWNRQKMTYESVRLSPERLETAKRCEALDKALRGGEFDDVLLNSFGDHAEVIVRKDGIQVNHYSHE